MVRYKATISYDGTLFSGFQRQPNARSIQEELEKTLLRLNSGIPVTVHGAGRTDAGVHAYGQVIHFDLPQERDPEKLRFGLDTQCPDDIDVVSIELVSEEFHARYNKHSKTYEFLVDAGRPKNPMMRNYATHYPYPLSLAPMQEAAKDLVYKQVRNMVGTLLKIGNGRMPVSQVKTVLESRDRNLAGPTAAGNGLYLKEIRYE